MTCADEPSVGSLRHPFSGDENDDSKWRHRMSMALEHLLEGWELRSAVQDGLLEEATSELLLG